MPVHKKDGTAKPGVARHRASPVGVVARDGAGAGGIVARVVEDPSARFFRAGWGHTPVRIRGVDWLAAGIGYVGDAGRFGNSPAHARPLRVGPGGEIIAAADAEVHAVVRDPHITGAC